VALISVGAANLYGHPDPATLHALAAAGAQVLRTDRLGSIVLRTNGHRLIVEAAGDTWEIGHPSLPR
jgi:competence protein ComEC